MRQISLILALSLIVLVATPAPAAMLFYDDCEDLFNTTTDYTKSGIGTCTGNDCVGIFPPNAAGVSNTYARSGTWAYYFTRAKIGGCTDTNCRHTELVLKVAQASFPFATERWIGYSSLIPTSVTAPTGSGLNWCMESQIHLTNSECTLLDNPTFVVDDADPSGAERFNHRLILRGSDACEATYDRPYALFNDGDEFSQEITKGTWHDIVLHIKLSKTDGQAISQYWVDGVLLVDDTDKNAWPKVDGSNQSPASWHVGAYCGSGLTNAYTVWIDEIRVGDATGNYAQVCPPIPPAAPVIVTPLDGAPAQSTSPTLDYGDYADSRADLQNVFSHYDSEFEISTSSATLSSGAFQTTIWTGSKTTDDLTTIDASGLSEGQTYYVHARYRATAGAIDRNDNGTAAPGDTADMYWSSWSAATSFLTSGTSPTGAGGAVLSAPGTGKGGATLTAPGAGKGGATLTGPP